MQISREGPLKITKTTIENAWRRRSSGQRIVVGDAECRGLALIINATSMSWVFAYKPRGTDPVSGKRFSSRSITIGSPQTHSPDEARAAAWKHKGQAKAGQDPARERRDHLARKAKIMAQTTSRLVSAYAEALPKRPKMRGAGLLSKRQVAYELSHLRAAIKTMGCEAKPISDINADNLRTMLKTCGAHMATARHRFGATSRFFDWAIDEGHLSINPCLLIAKGRRPRAVEPRKRFLTLSEISTLWTAAATLGDPARDLVHFLISVPCRRGEGASLDWSDINMVEAVWSQPGHLTKNRDAHRIFLPELAMRILRVRHATAGAPKTGLVFPGPRKGKKIDTFSDIKTALDEVAPQLGNWRFHDLRRTFATTLGEGGISETVADAVLNHRQSATRGGVLGVYQLAQRWPEQIAAMKYWNDKLTKAISPATERASIERDGEKIHEEGC